MTSLMEESRVNQNPLSNRDFSIRNHNFKSEISKETSTSSRKPNKRSISGCSSKVGSSSSSSSTQPPAYQEKLHETVSSSSSEIIPIYSKKRKLSNSIANQKNVHQSKTSTASTNPEENTINQSQKITQDSRDKPQQQQPNGNNHRYPIRKRSKPLPPSPQQLSRSNSSSSRTSKISKKSKMGNTQAHSRSSFSGGEGGQSSSSTTILPATPNKRETRSQRRKRERRQQQQRASTQTTAADTTSLGAVTSSSHTSSESAGEQLNRTLTKSSLEPSSRVLRSSTQAAAASSNASHDMTNQSSTSSTTTQNSTNLLCGVFNSPCTRSVSKQRADRGKTGNSEPTTSSSKSKQNHNTKNLQNKYLTPDMERSFHHFKSDHFWLPCDEVPERLAELNQAEILDHDEAIKNAWNENDSSQNIIVIDNGHTLHRHPVAQSTDAIRGKMCYSSGMHAIEFVWEHGQRGTHAVLGVCTKQMRLERPGYCSLIGNDQNGWGWDITRNRLFHDGSMVRAGSNLPITTERENGNTGRSKSQPTRPTDSQNIMHAAVEAATRAAQALTQNSAYKSNNFPSDYSRFEENSKTSSKQKTSKSNKKQPSSYSSSSPSYYNNCISDFENGDDATAYYPNGTDDYVIPARIIMILDCDEGWVGFCSEGKWLGVAFSTLKRVDKNGIKRLPGPLYPCISCVWGNCEVSMKPLCSISAKAISLQEICRKSLWRAAGGPARGFYSTEQMCKIINYEEHTSGPIPDKLKRYLLAPTRHSLPSKILADEFCNGNFLTYHHRQLNSAYPDEHSSSLTEINSNEPLPPSHPHHNIHNNTLVSPEVQEYNTKHCTKYNLRKYSKPATTSDSMVGVKPKSKKSKNDSVSGITGYEVSKSFSPRPSNPQARDRSKKVRGKK